VSLLLIILEKNKLLQLFYSLKKITGIIKLGQSGGIAMNSPRVEKQQG
tara:strand:- start:1108 stop:1251 length:144 start_codon:yes stop_codon:yes gene_type:complete